MGRLASWRNLSIGARRIFQSFRNVTPTPRTRTFQRILTTPPDTNPPCKPFAPRRLRLQDAGSQGSPGTQLYYSRGQTRRFPPRHRSKTGVDHFHPCAVHIANRGGVESANGRKRTQGTQKNFSAFYVFFRGQIDEKQRAKPCHAFVWPLRFPPCSVLIAIHSLLPAFHFPLPTPHSPLPAPHPAPCSSPARQAGPTLPHFRVCRRRVVSGSFFAPNPPPTPDSRRARLLFTTPYSATPCGHSYGILDDKRGHSNR